MVEILLADPVNRLSKQPLDFLSPEAKAYVTQHLKDMQNPEPLAQVDRVPRS